MSGSTLVPSLFGFTLIAVLVIAVASFVWFLRKRSNRHPLEGGRGEAIDAQRDAAIEAARANPQVDPATREAGGGTIRES